MFTGDNFSTSSLTDEDLKEFQDASLEDTSAIEKQDENTDDKEKEEFSETPKPKDGVGSMDLDDIEEETEEQEESKEEEEKEEDKKETPETKKESKSKSKQKEEVVLDFNAVYKNYVKKGLWVPVTDEEGNEIEVNDEETFEKLMDWQVQNAAESTLKERESEYGEQYQTLVNHLKNGGSIEELASSFQQERDLDEIDTETLEGAEEILTAYYESLDWDKTDIKDQIEALKDRGDDSFKSFASKRKADLKKTFSAEREEIIAQQQIQAKRLKDYQENYNKEFKKAIHSQEVHEREKKELEKFYYDLKNPVNGGKASDFYVKFEEIKQNPSKWMKLVQFIKDFDSFEKKETTEKKVKTSLFKMMREGEMTTKKVSETPEPTKKQTKGPPTTFKQFYNKV